MAYTLEQRIFLVLRFHCLDQSIIKTRRSSQKKNHVTKGSKRGTIKVLYEKCQLILNINDDPTRNIENPRVTVTDANVEVV